MSGEASYTFTMRKHAHEARHKTQIVYVASSTTNAPQEYRAFVQNFKKELRLRTSALVLEWLDQGEPLMEDFYKRNLKNVSMCHTMIAFVDQPSIGVGLEISAALRESKFLLCLTEEGVRVSRLLLAAAEMYGFPVHAYVDVEDAVQVAVDFIKSRETVDFL